MSVEVGCLVPGKGQRAVQGSVIRSGIVVGGV